MPIAIGGKNRAIITGGGGGLMGWWLVGVCLGNYLTWVFWGGIMFWALH